MNPKTILKQAWKDWGNRKEKNDRHSRKNKERLIQFLRSRNYEAAITDLNKAKTYGEFFYALHTIIRTVKSLQKNQPNDVECTYLLTQLQELTQTLESQHDMILDDDVDFSRVNYVIQRGPALSGDISTLQALSFNTLHSWWNAAATSSGTNHSAYQNSFPIPASQHPLVIADRMCKILSAPDAAPTNSTPLLQSTNADPNNSFKKNLRKTLLRNGLDFDALKNACKRGISTKAQNRKNSKKAWAAGIAAGFLGVILGAIAGPIAGILIALKKGSAGTEGCQLLLALALGPIIGAGVLASYFGTKAMQSVKEGEVEHTLSEGHKKLREGKPDEAAGLFAEIGMGQDYHPDSWPRVQSGRAPESAAGPDAVASPAPSLAAAAAVPAWRPSVTADGADSRSHTAARESHQCLLGSGQHYGEQSRASTGGTVGFTPAQYGVG